MLDVALVNKALEQVRPFMQRDGGDIELVKIEGTTVYVRLKGACAGCPISFMTLTYGVQEALKKELPLVEKVVAVKDEV